MIAAALLAVIFVFFIGERVIPPNPEGRDFFYGAGRLSGADLYDWDKQVEAMRDYSRVYKVFPRPPFIAAIMRPFTLLPYPDAVLVWQALNAFALLGFILLLARDVTDIARVAFFAPLYLAVSLAQDTPMILFVLGAGIRLIEAGKLGRAGLMLAYLSQKPHLFALLPIVLLRWRRATVGIVCGGLALFGGCALWAGWDWPVRMVRISRAWDASYVYHTVNIHGAVDWIQSDVLRRALWVIGCAVILLCLRRVTQGATSPRLLVSAAVFGSLAVSYRALTFDGALVLPFLLITGLPVPLCILVGLCSAMPLLPAPIITFAIPLGYVFLCCGDMSRSGPSSPRLCTPPSLTKDSVDVARLLRHT